MSDEEQSFKFDERYYDILLNKSLTWEHLDKAPVTGFRPEERWQWEAKDDEGVLVRVAELAYLTFSYTDIG